MCIRDRHIGVIPGIDKFVKEFTSKKAAGPRGYLLDLGLVPLKSLKESVSKVN